MSSFSATHWLISAVILYLLVKGVMSLLGIGGGKKNMVCTTCGHHGGTTMKTRGSMWIEIILWLCFIIPGVIYSIWRLTTRADACQSCGGTTLVPDTSPVGIRLLAEQNAGAKT